MTRTRHILWTLMKLRHLCAEKSLRLDVYELAGRTRLEVIPIGTEHPIAFSDSVQGVFPTLSALIGSVAEYQPSPSQPKHPKTPTTSAFP